MTITYKCNMHFYHLVLFTSIIALFTVENLFSSAERSIVKTGLEQLIRHEPAGTEALTEAITAQLKDLDIDDQYYPGKQSTNAATKIADQFKNQLPEDPEECIGFLRSLTLPSNTKISIAASSTKAIAKAGTSGAGNARLLAFIVELFLIYQVQGLLTEYYLKHHPEVYNAGKNIKIQTLPLYMCNCEAAPIAKRFTLILYCIHDVQQRFTTDKRIVITAQNAGALFMEYLIVRGLQFVGYRLFTVNIIDQTYRVIGHKSNTAQERSSYIKEFATRLHWKMPQIYTPDQTAIIKGLNIFGSASDYIEVCKKNPVFKATIMTAIDAAMNGIPSEFTKPFVGKAETATKYRPLVNRIDISVADYDERRDLIIYIPHFCRPRLYWDRLLFSDEDRTASMKIITSLANRLEPLRLQDIDAYRKQLVDGIIDQIKIILAKEHQEESASLIRARIEGKQMETSNLAKLSSKQVEQMVAARTKQSFFEHQKRTTHITLKYKMDAYVLFKELVHQTLRPNGVAYILGTNILQRIDEKYKEKYYYSPFEFFGANDIRCILRSPEFIEQQL